MSATFEPARDFEANLAKDPDIRQTLLELANEAMAAAQRASPTPTFAERLFVADEGGQVVLETTWSLWAIIEFGSVNSPPYAPLRRGCEAVGLELTDR